MKEKIEIILCFFNAAVFGLRMEITVFFSRQFIQKLHHVPSVSLVYIFEQMIIIILLIFQIIALKRSTQEDIYLIRTNCFLLLVIYCVRCLYNQKFNQINNNIKSLFFFIIIYLQFDQARNNDKIWNRSYLLKMILHAYRAQVCVSVTRKRKKKLSHLLKDIQIEHFPLCFKSYTLITYYPTFLNTFKLKIRYM